MASEYPEHEKLKSLNGVNQTVGDFIEWLGERDLIIAEYGNGTELMPASKSRDSLLAEFFEIDRQKLEREKRQMLDAIRANPLPSADRRSVP